MPNFRQIHVSIWKDTWFLDLEPDEKLLFIYLFSNESTSLSGMYRLSAKVVSFETSIDKKRMAEIMDKFAKAGKVYTDGDVIWVVHMRKYHETKSSKVLTRIASDIADIQDCTLKRKYIAYYNQKIPYPNNEKSLDTPPQLKEDEDKDEQEDEQEKVDEPFRILFDAFLQSSGIAETMLNLQRAADVVSKEWIPANVTADEVKSAITALQNKGYNITGPWSITNSINMQRSGKKGSANKPLSEKYKLPEDYDEEEEYEDDDEPVVDTKWQTFVEQHVKDVRWRNLLEYGGYDGSGKVVIHVPETAMAEAKSRFGSTLSRYYLGNFVLESVAI